MFDMGFLELLLVGVVGLLVLGPERLPKAARTLGLWIGKIKRTVSGMQREISAQLEAEELRQKLDEQQKKLDEGVKQVKRGVESLAEEEASPAASGTGREPSTPPETGPDGEEAPPAPSSTPPAAPPEKRLDDALSKARTEEGDEARETHSDKDSASR